MGKNVHKLMVDISCKDLDLTIGRHLSKMEENKTTQSI
jgi:hypothetical protein